ncbi:MAG: aspartate 1-decarboxylase [Dehalococcoidia bacterium]
MRTMLKSKIHRARITEVNVDYEGSLTIDRLLMEAADILPYEKVQLVDINNGARLETYAVEGEPGSGTICVNGAAARLAAKGDLVIILTYSQVSDEEAITMKPNLVHVDSRNRISSRSRVPDNGGDPCALPLVS